MRFRVKHRASCFAEKFKPAHADCYGVYCINCEELGGVTPEHSVALEAARECNAAAKAKMKSNCAFDVVYVVAGHPVVNANDAMTIWLPQVNGQAAKWTLTIAEFETMFERVEE